MNVIPDEPSLIGQTVELPDGTLALVIDSLLDPLNLDYPILVLQPHGAGGEILKLSLCEVDP